MSCHYTLLQCIGALVCCPSKSSPNKALDLGSCWFFRKRNRPKVVSKPSGYNIEPSLTHEASMCVSRIRRFRRKKYYLLLFSFDLLYCSTTLPYFTTCAHRQ